MTRMTGPDCAVMCNLINTHTHTHTHTHTKGGNENEVEGEKPGNLRSDTVDVTSDQHPQPLLIDPTPQRNRRIVGRTIIIAPRDIKQRRGSGRVEEGRRSARNFKRLRNGDTWLVGGEEKNYTRRASVLQEVPTEHI